MTQYTDEGLVTDEPSIAVMFLGEELQGFWGEDLCPLHRFEGIRLLGESEEITLSAHGGHERILLPWPLVAEKLKPVEGDPVVINSMASFDDRDIGISIYNAAECPGSVPPKLDRFNWRVVNICQTYGKLRELLKWCEGKV